MNPRLGISSACAKHLDSEELASLVLSLGGRTVDLRAGRGHRWEQSGLDGFRALGVEVGHVGLSVVLGNPRHDPEKVAKEAARYGGVPLRVFAAEHVAADDQLVAEQVEALTGAAGPVGDVLVDTHQGYASLRQIEELHDRYGVRAVVDLEGLAFLEPSVEKAAARLAAFTQTVHVKGFALRPDRSRPGTGHSAPPTGSSCPGPGRRSPGFPASACNPRRVPWRKTSPFWRRSGPSPD